MDLNRATILGRLTQDPELRSTPSGRSVANMTVATNRVWTDDEGEQQERTEFHNCVIWGKLAEIAGQYLSKGRRVYCEGRLQTRDWTGDDGVKRYRTEIVVNNLIMLGGTQQEGGSQGQRQPPPQQTPQQQGQSQNQGGGSPGQQEEEEIEVEDIPF
ncbi:MAG: single-stranded DNA-binding protein [Parcubacteria group bacterium QH_9_35_7]|nr:MAG: single-stranded DNA-binding protein [Parcubacteria group bacterium QH_9_35_7]